MDAKTYLEEHGIDEIFVKKTFGWKWDDKKITIPYIENGKILFNRYRNFEGENKFTADKGSHARLYCPTKIKKLDWIVFCEGEPDMVRLWQEGIPATTSGGVTSVSKLDVEVLRDKEIFLCLDNDEAGKKSVNGYIERLEEVGCRVSVIDIPEGSKDVCEFFRSNNKDNFEELMSTAKSSDEWILSGNKEIQILGGKEFMELKYPDVKWLVKGLIRDTGFNIIQGESGVGKTTVAHSIIKSVLEGSPWIKDDFKCKRTNVLIIDKENSLGDTQKRFREMGIKTDGLFMYKDAEYLSLIDNNGDTTKEAAYLKRFIRVNQVGLVLFDSMADFFVGNENDSGNAAVNIQAWKRICGDACILVLHHEKKVQNGVRTSGMSRGRGSTHIAASAESIIGFSADEGRPEMLTVDHIKVRGGKKLNSFALKMKVKNIYMTDETIVYGFDWAGEIQNSKRARAEAEDAITAFYEIANDWYDIKTIMASVNTENLGERNIRDAIRFMVSINTLEERAGERNKKEYRMVL